MKIGVANRKAAAACDGRRLILKTLIIEGNLFQDHRIFIDFLGRRILNGDICCGAILSLV